MPATKHWIQKAIKHPGALHKELGVKQGEKIPAAKLDAAAKKGGKIGARARLAKSLKGMHHNQFQFGFTINLDVAKTRYDKLEGKQYLVVPMVMITEGVHNGSNGPLYYPSKELGKTPASWDHKPIVVYHPEENGVGISACRPDVLNTRKVGVILNTVYKDGKLKAEAWIDEERLKVVDNRVFLAINKKQMVEVSTGLYTDNEYVENAEWNGERYEAVAKNYRPDHLAILPDKKGSCSIADGAGLMRNANHTASHKRNLVEKAIQEAQSRPYAYVEDVTDDNRAIYHDKDSKLVHEGFTIDAKMNKAKMMGDPKPITRKMQYLDEKGNTVANVDEETLNIWSDVARAAAAEAHHAQSAGKKPSHTTKGRGASSSTKGGASSGDPSTRGTIKSPFTRTSSGGSSKLPGKSKQGGVGAKGVAPATKPKILPTPVRAKHGKNLLSDKDFNPKRGIHNMSMNKQNKIDHLIDNGGGVWNEDHRDFLEAQEDEQLDSFIDATAPIDEEPAAEESEEKAAENAEARVGADEGPEQDGNKTGIQGKGKTKPKKKPISDEKGITGQAEHTPPARNSTTPGPMTEKEWMEKAPPSIREIVHNSLRQNDMEKTKLVKAITDNKRSKFTQNALKTKPLEELRQIHALIEPERATSPVANYGGAGWGQGDEPVVNEGKVEPLALPGLGFGKK